MKHFASTVTLFCGEDKSLDTSYWLAVLLLWLKVKGLSRSVPRWSDKAVARTFFGEELLKMIPWPLGRNDNANSQKSELSSSGCAFECGFQDSMTFSDFRVVMTPINYKAWYRQPFVWSFEVLSDSREEMFSKTSKYSLPAAGGCRLLGRCSSPALRVDISHQHWRGFVGLLV